MQAGLIPFDSSGYGEMCLPTCTVRALDSGDPPSKGHTGIVGWELEVGASESFEPPYGQACSNMVGVKTDYSYNNGRKASTVEIDFKLQPGFLQTDYDHACLQLDGKMEPLPAAQQTCKIKRNPNPGLATCQCPSDSSTSSMIVSGTPKAGGKQEKITNTETIENNNVTKLPVGTTIGTAIGTFLVGIICGVVVNSIINKRSQKRNPTAGGGRKSSSVGVAPPKVVPHQAP